MKNHETHSFSNIYFLYVCKVVFPSDSLEPQSTIFLILIFQKNNY